MEKITFNIPYPPTKKGKSAFCRRFGLNAYYSGKHWAQRKKDADELHALTLVALKQARVRRGMVRGPVSITFAERRFPSIATKEPSPSISGTVPRLNASMDNAPANGFADASATICMDWSGPHGIMPFNRPITNG